MSNPLDIVLIIVIICGAVMGFIKGFITQLSSLLGLIVGLLVAKALYIPLAEWLCPTITQSMTLAQGISFIVIWVAVPFVFSIIASLLSKALEALSLGWVNRLLGFALGVLKYLLFASLFICVIEFIDADNKLINKETKDTSLLYHPVQKFAGIIFPVAKDVTQQIINRH